MKTVFVTGATSGIGYAVVRTLAAQGCRVLAAGRTREHCDAALAGIQRDIPWADVHFFTGDLMQQREVNRLADQVSHYLTESCAGKLDVLINNAGGVRTWYATTEDGYEQQFALNHLAGFLLTYRLLPYLVHAGGRMILTGSNSHRHARINWPDIMYKRHYNILLAYKQSKLCAMLFATAFNGRLGERGVRAYVVDPGLVRTDIGSKQTGSLVARFWDLRKRHGVAPEVAAQTYSFLCHQLPRPQALYYYLCQERKYGRGADDRRAADRLFELSEKLCGICYADANLRKDDQP